MDLNEIIKNAENLLSENEELECRKNQMELELLKKIESNYNKLFVPEIQELTKLDTKLADASGIFGLETRCETFCISGASSSFGTFFYITNRSNFNDHVVYNKILHRKYPDRDFPSDYKIHLLKEFISEDSTLSHLAEIKESFAERFETYAKTVSEKNEKLSAQIEILAEQLKESSSVEEKEDGSIEITLNGKTYIGTVKER